MASTGFAGTRGTAVEPDGHELIAQPVGDSRCFERVPPHVAVCCQLDAGSTHSEHTATFRARNLSGHPR